MEYRTQLEIDGLQRAEGVLDAAETFVGAHRGGGIAVCGRQVGADHVDAVERGLGGDAEGVLVEAERIVGDADLEMLRARHKINAGFGDDGLVRWCSSTRRGTRHV